MWKRARRAAHRLGLDDGQAADGDLAEQREVDAAAGVEDGGEPIVLCAVDWIGIANEGHDAFRDALAEAAGTTRDRVAVHTLRTETPLRYRDWVAGNRARVRAHGFPADGPKVEPWGARTLSVTGLTAAELAASIEKQRDGLLEVSKVLGIKAAIYQ